VTDARPKLDGIPRFRAGERGAYRATWEPSPRAPLGRYRFLITARRYRLASRPFRLRPAHSLKETVRRSGAELVVRLAYPAARREVDFTGRPGHAARGRAAVAVDGREITAPIRGGRARIAARRGARVRPVPAAARDAYGNRGG